MQIFCDIWDKIAQNLVVMQHQNFECHAETAPFNGAIWGEFSEQH